MKKTKVFFTILSLLSLYSLGQESADTVLLQEVTILSNRIEYFSDGAKKELLDSASLHFLPSSTLGDVLMYATPVLIRSYGNSGAAATISLRGAGPSRSPIFWEGFSLQSVTMGQTDLSLIPADAFNTIEIDHSASATQYGSGTFGGAISLSHRPQWREHSKASVYLSQASFGTYALQGGYSYGKESYELRGNLFYTQSQGNYPYYDYIKRDSMRRVNADHTSYGTIQQVHYKVSDKILTKAGLWYQVKQANLPAIMGANPYNFETQTDSSLRIFVEGLMCLSKGVLAVRSGLFSSYQLYTKKMRPTDERYSTYSEISSLQSHSHISYRYYPVSTVHIHAEGGVHVNQAEVDNYKDVEREQVYFGLAGIRYQKSGFKTHIGARKEFVAEQTIPLVYTIGLEYHFAEAPFAVRASTGKKYRRPNFNDLYWVEWGNPDLLPESGNAHEAGVTVQLIRKKSHELVFDFTGYYADITDMIMWIPVGSIWRPMNASHARLLGYEVRAKHRKDFSRLSLHQNFGLDVNHSHIVSLDSTHVIQGHSLYYVPKYSLSYFPTLSFKSWRFGASYSFTSERFYTYNRTLDSFFECSLFASLSMHTKKLSYMISFTAKNIFDAQYEYIRSYPVPGRSFALGLTFLFN